MEGSTKYASVVRGRSIDKDKGTFFGTNFKSKGISKSPLQSTRRCWKCDKDGNYIKDCKSKETKFSDGPDEKQSTKRKTTSDNGGYVYMASTNT
jgi:hypothetical protein